MKRLLIAGAFLVAGAGTAMADCPGPYPGGLLPFGGYTTTAPTGALQNTTLHGVIVDQDSLGRDFGLGGEVTVGKLAMCLTTEPGTAALTSISVVDTHPISAGSFFLSEFIFTIDGVAAGGITYSADSTSVTATLETVLASDVTHTLAITNVVQQHNGGTYTTGGHSYPVSGYATDGITVSVELLDEVPLPEPTSLALLGMGLAGLGALRRRGAQAA